jgi:hypothetical protein
MIIINKPFIETRYGKVYLKAMVTDECNRLSETCYFVTEEDYGKYFCDEVSDAFVTGLLLPALQSNQDIIVKGAISEKLYFNLTITIVFILSKAFNYKPIKIIPEKIVRMNFNSFAVGTGCSLGIDSFSTIIKHTADDCPDSYKLSHLTYFNVGAHGEKETEMVNKSFQNDLIKIKEFAEEIKLPLITVESNLPVFFRSYSFNFNQTHVIRNMSMVLSLQKLFRKYIYSSGYPVSEIHLSSVDPTYMEGLLQPNLSTENTELIVGGPNLSRAEKANEICDNNLVQKHLYVCVKDLAINNKMNLGPWVKIQDVEKRNCSGCDKCLRTLLVFEIIGKLDEYNELFDLPKYHSLKKLFMAKVIGLKNKSFVFKDVYSLAIKNNYKISFLSRLLSLVYKFGIVNLFYKIVLKFKNNS